MRKRVVSIITWPLRLLRRLLGLLAGLLGKLGRLLFRKRGKPSGPGRPAAPAKPGKFRKLGAPFRKLAGLKGRARIAALVILGVIVIVAVLSLRPGPNAEKDVRATLDRYAAATRQKDYQTLCDDLYADELVQRIRNAGLPCEVALKTGLEDRQNPQLTVLGVEVTGDQALARVRSTAIGEQPSLDTVKLVKQDGGWRVASLSEPGSSASQTP